MSVLNRMVRIPALLIAALLACSVSAGAFAGQPDWDWKKVVGAKECYDCHEPEGQVWQATHHATGFAADKEAEAKELAVLMGFKKHDDASSTCATCHYTVGANRSKTKQKISRKEPGVSCESCHGPGEEYIKDHQEMEKLEDGSAEMKALKAKLDGMGMIRPEHTYKLAKNCISCHLVTEQELVNKGKHSTGSDFELVAWSQGEVRHNFDPADASETNQVASKEHQRMLYLVGQAVQLELALRALGGAAAGTEFAKGMKAKAMKALENLKAANGKIQSNPLKAIVTAGDAGIGDAGKAAAQADVVSAKAQMLAGESGNNFAAIDGMLPAAGAYVGEPAR